MKSKSPLSLHDVLSTYYKLLSYRFGTTWGWVINDRILILGWTNPVTLALLSLIVCSCYVSHIIRSALEEVSVHCHVFNEYCIPALQENTLFLYYLALAVFYGSLESMSVLPSLFISLWENWRTGIWFIPALDHRDCCCTVIYLSITAVFKSVT